MSKWSNKFIFNLQWSKAILILQIEQIFFSVVNQVVVVGQFLTFRVRTNIFDSMCLVTILSFWPKRAFSSVCLKRTQKQVHFSPGVEWARRWCRMSHTSTNPFPNRTSSCAVIRDIHDVNKRGRLNSTAIWVFVVDFVECLQRIFLITD